MTENKNEEEQGAPSAPEEKKEEKEEKKEEEKKTPETPAPQDDPVKKELDKEEGKKKTYTKRERLNFEKGKIEEQLSGLDEDEGIPITEDDNTPVTVGMLNKREKELAQKTALVLAEAIDDESERNLTIHYLKNRVTPSGNAEDDLRFARAAVNSVKHAEIATEMSRKKTPGAKPSPSGAPASHEKVFTPTDEERVFMKSPYNLKKEDIIKARERTQSAQTN